MCVFVCLQVLWVYKCKCCHWCAPPASYIFTAFKHNHQHNTCDSVDWLKTCTKIIQTVMLFLTFTLSQIYSQESYWNKLILLFPSIYYYIMKSWECQCYVPFYLAYTSSRSPKTCIHICHSVFDIVHNYFIIECEFDMIFCSN